MSPILVIDENGENLGKMETKKALELASSKNLDLVEVSPSSRPPVCKILSWSKFKYNISKKRRTSVKGKAKEQKEMWFSPYIGQGDIDHKIKKVVEFLDKKHPVKLTIRVKGRVTQDVIKSQLDNILKQLGDKFETDEGPKREGRNLSIRILPKK